MFWRKKGGTQKERCLWLQKIPASWRPQPQQGTLYVLGEFPHLYEKKESPLVSEMAFGLTESNESCVVLDIPWSGRPNDVDEQPFQELLYANQVEFSVGSHKISVGGKLVETKNLAVACNEPKQLHPLLDHLFRKWFWFEFNLRCYSVAASRQLAEQVVADWLSAFERVGILNKYEARMQQLTIELAKRCSVAWRIPSDRDYFEIASGSLSLDALHKRLQNEAEKCGVQVMLKQAEESSSLKGTP